MSAIGTRTSQKAHAWFEADLQTAVTREWLGRFPSIPRGQNCSLGVHVEELWLRVPRLKTPEVAGEALASPRAPRLLSAIWSARVFTFLRRQWRPMAISQFSLGSSWAPAQFAWALHSPS